MKNEMVEDKNNCAEPKPKWITYVVRQKDGAYQTYTEPYIEGAPEHDVMPNQNSFLALFRGSNFDSVVKEANKFIDQKQKEEIDSMTFEKIKELNKSNKLQKVYEILPNGKGYRMKSLDELRKEGLVQ
jgi:deoxycytidine triphosphate deaminase